MKPRTVYLVSLTPPDEKDTVIHLPVLTTAYLTPGLSLASYDGIILTSKQGVAALREGFEGWQRLPLLCVGRATQKAAEAAGGRVLACADGYGEGIVSLMDARLRAMRWLYARPAVVASDFAERLRAEGVAVEEAVVYETRCNDDALPTAPEADAVLIFTSPSAVACYERRFVIEEGQSLVAIGTTTLGALGGRAARVAPEPTLAACVALAHTIAKEHEPC